MAALSVTRLPTGRPGQLLAVLLVCLALALAWTAVASPLLDWHAERAEALDRRATLARRMAQIAATLPQLQAEANAAAHSGPAPVALLAGSSDAVAGAALQQKLQEMAAGSGLTLSSAETLPPQQSGAYRLIAVRVAVNAPWPGLVKLLQSIDEANPQMLVDDLQLHGQAGYIRQPDAPLDASFTAMAFRAGTVAPPPPPPQ